MKNIRMIDSEETLEKVLAMPRVLIFKNSTSCGISRAALGELQRFAETTENDIEMYIVNVIENRRLSAMIAQKTKIVHQSPQALYIVAGNTVWHDSHFGITQKELERATK